METDRIDQMVAQASRVSSDSLEDVRIDVAAHEALAELLALGKGDARGMAEVGTPRRRVRRGVVVGILAATLAGTTVAVAAGWISAHTGVKVHDEGIGTGEMIRLDASDLDVVLDRLRQGIPFPSDEAFDRTKGNISQEEPTQTSTSSLKSILAFNAACEWTGYWLDAFHGGDEAAMARAQTVLDEIPTWPLISSGGMGKLLELRAKGARLRDPTLFQQEYDINCAGGSPGSHDAG